MSGRRSISEQRERFAGSVPSARGRRVVDRPDEHGQRIAVNHELRCEVGGDHTTTLPPPELGCDVLEDALDDVGVVVDAELVRHGQEQRVGGGDRLVLGQLADEQVGLGGVAAAEDGPRGRVDVADVILAPSPWPK